MSDIHDSTNELKKAVNFFNQNKIDKIFFCGDLCHAETLTLFQDLKSSVRAVFGNMDKERKRIFARSKTLALDFCYPAKPLAHWELNLEQAKIAMIHGDETPRTENLILSGHFDFLFSGHSHIPQIGKVGRTLLVNPGSICGWTGLDREEIDPSCALVNINEKRARIIKL